MREFSVTVKSREGVHARPALLLSQKAKHFPCRIEVEYQGKRANVKNVMKLMSLSIPYKETITFYIEGEDEETTALALEDYCSRNL